MMNHKAAHLANAAVFLSTDDGLELGFGQKTLYVAMMLSKTHDWTPHKQQASVKEVAYV